MTDGVCQIGELPAGDLKENNPLLKLICHLLPIFWYGSVKPALTLVLKLKLKFLDRKSVV